MKLTSHEEDILGDMQFDAYELWEWYVYIRTHYPEMSEAEIISYGRDLLVSWFERGWLIAFKSREDKSVLSVEEFLAKVDELGAKITDPNKALILLDLTKQASKDVNWLGDA
ncbi:MAG: hypothetical protein EA357_01905 [Micavibrio sp.]|nr:MAG: hypothetical protein EA357_01905 [Micavibrio sp.]